MTAGAGITRPGATTAGAIGTMVVIETMPATEIALIATAGIGKTESAMTGRPSEAARLNAFNHRLRHPRKARAGCGATPAPLAKASLPTTIEAEAPGLQTQQTAERLHRPTYTEPCHALPPEAPVEMARRSGALRLQRPACVQPGHSLH